MLTASQVNSRHILLVICYVAFVSLGLPDPLIGVAWPSVRQTFNLQQSDISWIFVASGCSYFLSSFLAGRLLKVINVGLLLAVSSGLVALSAFNYGTATHWPWFALGALFHGLGSGAIDAGLNHYVASHFSARHMNWLHASYSLGAMLGPAVMATCIANGGKWRLAYLIVGTALFVLALLFLLTHSRWKDRTTASLWKDSQDDIESTVARVVEEGPSTPPLTGGEIPLAPPSTGSVLGNRVVQLSIVIFFIYTGLEVALGQWSFTILTEARGVETKTAGFWVTIYWGSILAGRVILGFIVDRIRIDILLRLSLLTALAGTALLATNPFAQSAPISLALSGFGLAIIFPCLMTQTPQRLGKESAAHAIGFQVGAAMLGAAVVPSVCSLIGQHLGLAMVPPTILGSAFLLYLLHDLLVKLAPSNGKR